MKHSKNDNAVRINREEDLVGELPRECAPDALIIHDCSDCLMIRANMRKGRGEQELLSRLLSLFIFT
jgi:hypothetical protein